VSEKFQVLKSAETLARQSASLEALFYRRRKLGKKTRDHFPKVEWMHRALKWIPRRSCACLPKIDVKHEASQVIAAVVAAMVQGLRWDQDSTLSKKRFAEASEHQIILTRQHDCVLIHTRMENATTNRTWGSADSEVIEETNASNQRRLTSIFPRGWMKSDSW
jgi:hypothetical protein